MAPNVITHCQAVVRWERAVRRLCKVLSAHQLAVMGSIQVFQLKILLCESQYASQRSLFHTTRITLLHCRVEHSQQALAFVIYVYETSLTSSSDRTHCIDVPPLSQLSFVSQCHL